MPGADRRVVVVDYGIEPSPEPGDQWIIVGRGDASDETWLPEVYVPLYADSDNLDTAWLKLLMTLNLSGTHCQIQASLATLREELAE
jgi:hypothetical protein